MFCLKYLPYILMDQTCRVIKNKVPSGLHFSRPCVHVHVCNCGHLIILCFDCSSLRIAYLGLTLGLRTASFFLCVLGLVVLRRHVQRQERNTLANGGTGVAAGELQALRKEENNSCNMDQCSRTTDYDPERETRL